MNRSVSSDKYHLSTRLVYVVLDHETHTHTHKHTHTHACTHTHTHARTHTRMHAHTHARTRTHTHTHTHTSISTYLADSWNETLGILKCFQFGGGGGIAKEEKSQLQMRCRLQTTQCHRVLTVGTPSAHPAMHPHSLASLHQAYHFRTHSRLIK